MPTSSGNCHVGGHHLHHRRFSNGREEVYCNTCGWRPFYDDDVVFSAEEAARFEAVGSADRNLPADAPKWPPDCWYHEAHGLHDEAHHQAHGGLHICVPLNFARPPKGDSP